MQTTHQTATHFSGALMGFVIIYLTWKIVTENKDIRWCVFLGFICGFSLFIDLYFSLFSIIAVILSLFILKINSFNFQRNLKKFFFLFFTFLIGLIPFIYYHFILYSPSQSFVYYNKTPTKHLKLEGVNRAIINLPFHLWKSFGFNYRNISLQYFFGILWMLLTIIAFIYLLMKILRRETFKNRFPWISIILLTLLNLLLVTIYPDSIQYWRTSLLMKFRYFTLFHISSILVVPYFLMDISKKLKGFLKYLPTSIILFIGIITFFNLTLPAKNYLYRPVDLPSLAQEEEPCNEINGYNCKFFLVNPYGKSKYPSEIKFGRLMKKNEKSCLDSENPIFCFKKLGFFFTYMRQHNPFLGLNLCERLSVSSRFEKECKRGVAMRTGYIYGYDKKLAFEKCNYFKNKSLTKMCFKGAKKCEESMK